MSENDINKFTIFVLICNYIELSGGHVSMVNTPQNDNIEIGPGSLKVSFSLKSGQLKRIKNTRTGVSFVINHKMLIELFSSFVNAFLNFPDRCTSTTELSLVW